MKKRPGRQFARAHIEAVAHKHTIAELAAMEWPTCTGGMTTIHPKTIANWLAASGIKAKPGLRPHELSAESKAEMLRLYAEGHSAKDLAERLWKDKGGVIRKFNRTTIYDTCVRRHNRREYLNRPLSEDSFNAMMLGFPLE